MEILGVEQFLFLYLFEFLMHTVLKIFTKITSVSSIKRIHIDIDIIDILNLLIFPKQNSSVDFYRLFLLFDVRILTIIPVACGHLKSF